MTKKTHCLLLSGLVLALRLGGQTPAGKPSHSGKIEGRVFEAGKGVADLTVYVQTGPSSAASFAPARTKTDEQGHYSFSRLAPGEYLLTTWRAGRRVTLSEANPEAGNIDIQLPPTGVIAGHVSDSEGRPAAGATIDLCSFAYRGGVRQFFHNDETKADENGDYRIEDLRPGEYYVSAFREKPTVRAISPNKGDAAATGATREVITYYPGATSPEAMLPIRLNLGAEGTGIDFKLVKTATYCAKAVLQTRARTSVRVSQNAAGVNATVAWGEATGGPLEICGLAPGSYEITALLHREESMYFDTAAQSDFAIGHADVNAGSILPIPGFAVRGRVQLAGKDKQRPSPAGIEVRAEPYVVELFGEDFKATVSDAGDFVIPRLYSRQYLLSVSHLPKGYYVQSASLRGRDVLNEPFRPGDGDLEITLANDSALVAGTVVDGDEHPVPEAHVILTPDPLPAALGRRIISRYADQNGQWRVEAMAPGKYFVYAVVDTGFYDEEGPEAVRAMVRDAKEVELQAGKGGEVKVVLGVMKR